MLRAAAFDVIKKVAEKCDISEDAVFINCVHSHTSFHVLAAVEELDDQDIFHLRRYQQFADRAWFALRS